jgi:hypothetical protein
MSEGNDVVGGRGLDRRADRRLGRKVGLFGHALADVVRQAERHARPAGGERIRPEDAAVLHDELAGHVEADADPGALLA